LRRSGFHQGETQVTNTNTGIDGKALQSIIDRIERLDVDAQAVKEDIAEVKSEAKSAGYDLKILNKVLARRKKTREVLAEEEELVLMYESSLGLFD
jgi:uncharacterized protein (UPF0335 family)